MREECLFRIQLFLHQFLGVVKASVAGTLMSGSDAGSFPIGFGDGMMARAKGTPIMKWSSMRWPETGCAPPPVVSPMSVARSNFSGCSRLFAAGKVSCDVRT